MTLSGCRGASYRGLNGHPGCATSGCGRPEHLQPCSVPHRVRHRNLHPVRRRPWIHRPELVPCSRSAPRRARRHRRFRRSPTASRTALGQSDQCRWLLRVSPLRCPVHPENAQSPLLPGQVLRRPRAALKRRTIAMTAARLPMPSTTRLAPPGSGLLRL